MFYISLPYFYQNSQFNMFFKEYINEARFSKKDKLIADFSIEYVYGSFPWSIWNGEINVHTGKAVLTPEMEKIFSQTNTPIRLDASNICLTKNDFFDIHENATLRASFGTNRVYEIYDLDFISYLSERDLNNKFIISKNINIPTPLSEEGINLLAQGNMVDLINVGYQVYFDLNKIEDKSKIEVSIGLCSDCGIDKQIECSKAESNYIYNYSGQSSYLNCPFLHNSDNYYSEMLPFINQGIKHFKIVTSLQNLDEFNIRVINSFIKPEYVGECLSEYHRKIRLQ